MSASVPRGVRVPADATALQSTAVPTARAGDALPVGLPAGTPVALVVLRQAVALAWDGGSCVADGEAGTILAPLLERGWRWTWWSAAAAAAPLVAAGLHVRACWDLTAVGRLVFGLRRSDPAAVWAAGEGLPEPDPLRGTGADLFDLDTDDDGPLRADGQLSRAWTRDGWRRDLTTARRWAELAVQAQARQQDALEGLRDPRPAPTGTSLPVLTAWAESAVALLCVELEVTGLPLDVAVAAAHLRTLLGPRPGDQGQAAQQRRARDDAVLAAFGGASADLRSPLQVRALLARVGLDLPDTRSWRLEPHAATSAPVAALLAWRKAERLATTYGWTWLERHVHADGRLRGSWSVADGAAGRMTASAGLHNLPAELRPAVRAHDGHVLVRGDLGQVEPRVLAVVSGDAALARAAAEPDLYAPVAAALGVDRPTAKVAVLAAMYGQTSGTAGAALRDLDRAYPVAMAYLRAAEQAGRTGGELRTYGGRRLALVPPAEPAASGAGRFARNAVVQGAAAELFKAWAATVRSALPGLGGEIVLCLHDELVLHVPASRAQDASRLLQDALAATARWWAAGSGVRLVAEVSVGQSWAGAHAELTRARRPAS